MRTKIELEIIERVKRMREEHGYTQEVLSYALGFDRIFINKYEQGLRCYNYNQLNALVENHSKLIPLGQIKLTPSAWRN